MSTAVIPTQIEEAARKADEMIMAATQTPGFSIDDGVPMPSASSDLEPTPATPAPGDPPTDAPPKDDWEQRYKVLKGKYDAEVPRLHSEVASVRELVTLLTKQMQQQPQVPQTPEADPFAISDKEREEYEPAFLSFVERLVRKVATEIVDVKLNEVKPTIQNIAESHNKTTFDLFRERLDTLAPQWGKTNHNPEFLEWLNQEDELSGIPRKEMFNTYVSQQDAKAVARYFNAFAKEQMPVTPNTTKSNVADELQRMASPSTRTGAGAPKGGDKRMYTAADITRLYNDHSKGRISTADFAKIEQDIFVAQREGRIIP